MAQGWAPVDELIVTTVPASQADLPVTKEFPVSAGGARMLALEIRTGTTVGTVSAKMQKAFGPNWVDTKSVTLTAGAGGYFYLRFLDIDSADWIYLPLYSKARVVVTTAAASTVELISIKDLQER